MRDDIVALQRKNARKKTCSVEFLDAFGMLDRTVTQTLLQHLAFWNGKTCLLLQIMYGPVLELRHDCSLYISGCRHKLDMDARLERLAAEIFQYGGGKERQHRHPTITKKIIVCGEAEDLLDALVRSVYPLEDSFFWMMQ